MGKTFDFIIYDPATDRIVAKRDITPTEGVDSVTISPLGDYFLAYFEPLPDGKVGSDANPGGLMIYDKDLKNGRCLVRAIGHSDPALDAQGREVLVYQDNDNDTIAMCDLATGKITDLYLIDFSRTALGPGGRVVRLAHTRSLVDEKQEHDYRAEPQATVDMNFTRVLFTSN
jgi:hypothetical protein